MAIDFADLTALQDTLKTVYGEGLTEQFANEKITYNQLPVSDRKIGGKGYNFAVQYANPAGIGARGESHKLPDPLAGKYDQGTITPKYVYGSIRLTGPAIEAAKGNMQAFVDGLEGQIEQTYNEIVVDLNRQTWGDGFGKLATLSQASDALATGATWTVTCDNAVGVRYLREGMLVDFYDGASVDQSSVASRIYSVDFNNKTCEMEGNDGTYKANHPITGFSSYTIATDAVPDGAVMVKMGTRDASHATTDTSYELAGMLAIVDDGTNVSSFENIDESTYTAWKANVLSNSGVDRELTEDLMIQTCNLVRVRSGKEIGTIRLGEGQLRKYFNLLAGDRRFVDTGNFTGGFQTVKFAYNGNIDMVMDPYTTPGSIFFEPKGVIQRYELKPLGFLNYDQQMHMRSGYDQWDMHLAIYTNLGCEQRSCLARLKDLVEPDLV